MLRLGVIGGAEGNGHPYSWSAIFNGYDREKIRKCGFPVIPQYLDEQTWPSSRIDSAVVTHVWTQSPKLSRQIAETVFIENVADNFGDFVGQVDAVLLARDDASSHPALATPFLKAGTPIYIDKPIALSIKGLEALYALEQYPGQIFTCSALRYSDDLKLSDADVATTGNFVEIFAFTPKDWDRYAVHVIEPVLNLVGDQGAIVDLAAVHGKNSGGELKIEWESGVKARILALGPGAAAPITIRVFGSEGWKDLFFEDTFSAFKAALRDFVDGVIEKDVRSRPEFNRKVVSLIEAGRNAS